MTRTTDVYVLTENPRTGRERIMRTGMTNRKCRRPETDCILQHNAFVAALPQKLYGQNTLIEQSCTCLHYSNKAVKNVILPYKHTVLNSLSAAKTSVINVHSATFKNHACQDLHHAHVNHWESKFETLIV